MLDPADQVNAGALLGVLSDAAIMDTDPHFFRRGLEVVMPEDEVVVISEDSSNEVLARSPISITAPCLCGKCCHRGTPAGILSFIPRTRETTAILQLEFH